MLRHLLLISILLLPRLVAAQDWAFSGLPGDRATPEINIRLTHTDWGWLYGNTSDPGTRYAGETYYATTGQLTLTCTGNGAAVNSIHIDSPFAGVSEPVTGLRAGQQTVVLDASALPLLAPRRTDMEHACEENGLGTLPFEKGARVVLGCRSPGGTTTSHDIDWLTQVNVECRSPLSRVEQTVYRYRCDDGKMRMPAGTMRQERDVNQILRILCYDDNGARIGVAERLGAVAALHVCVGGSVYPSERLQYDVPEPFMERFWIRNATPGQGVPADQPVPCVYGP